MRRSKAKISCFNSYMQTMNDYVSSQEDEYIKTDYEPEISLECNDYETQQILCDANPQQDEETHLKQIDEQNSTNKIQISLPLKKQINKSSSECKEYASSINHQAKKFEQISMVGQDQLKKMSIESLKSESTSETRKKNKFLSKDQKQRLQYDIKSERFLMPELIRKYGISRSTIKRYLAEINKYGQILMPNQKIRVVSASKQNKIMKFIIESIEKNPFLSQKQMALMIKEEMKLEVSQQTVSLILKKSNITKKKGMITYKEGNTEENIEKRFEYAKMYQNINEDKVIFMDETGFNECFQIEYGYAPRGKRLLKQKSGKKGHKIVVILSMTYSNLCHWDIVNLSVKTEDIASYIKKFPKVFRGYTLIMDNARVHKTQEVSQAIACAGLNVNFLPPYSPQLNPIQLVFGRLKGLYKSMMGVKLQNPEIELSQKVNTCLKKLSESNLENYKRPVNFWIKQALKRKKFNEVVEQKQ